MLFRSVVDAEKKEANVTREIDGGLEEVKAKLPLVVTTDLRYVLIFLRVYVVHSQGYKF